MFEGIRMFFAQKRVIAPKPIIATEDIPMEGNAHLNPDLVPVTRVTTADLTDRQIPAQRQTIRVAIVGNSNSVMMDSYSHMLARTPGITVTNKSIGSTPCVLLLDFLALERDLDFDFVIVDTAVCDAIWAYTLTRERAQETLEIFISSLQARSKAQIIFLTIPTRMALLSPASRWQESLYRDVAARFHLPILDGFELVRGLVGRFKMSLATRSAEQAKRLATAFGLPEQLSEVMAWRSLRDRDVPSNALGVFGFNDHLHFSRMLHAVIFELLRQFIVQLPLIRNQDGWITPDITATPPVVIAIPLVGGSPAPRRNSWISRDLVLLSVGETGRYECPPGYRPYGLLLNASVTSCFLRMKGSAGEKTFELHYSPQHTNWVAAIIPIGDDIGDGNIEVEVLETAAGAPYDALATRAGGTTPGPALAELGELILVRDDWRKLVATLPTEAAPALHIEGLPWAKPIIAEAAGRAAPIIYSVEAQGQFLDEACERFITVSLSRAEAPLSLADQARLLLVLGKMKDLTGFVATALRQQPEDIDLLSMHSALQMIEGVDAVGKEELLRRAREKARTGSLVEAEAIYEEGMARFTSEVLFWFEHASIAHQRKDWPEATRRWEMMQELFPRHESWCLGLYICMRNTGRVDEAESHIEAVVERFGDFADAAAAHARIPVDKGDVPEALKRLRSVRQRFPDHVRNRKALIEFLIAHDMFGEARQQLGDLVEEGLIRHDLLPLAINLANTQEGFNWIILIWDRLAGSVPDHKWLMTQTAVLFDRFSATNNCDFLLPWMRADANERSRHESMNVTGG